MISWDTSLACPPSPDHCILTDKTGTVYDLEFLSRATSDWQADTNTKADGKYVVVEISVGFPLSVDLWVCSLV